MYRPSKYLTHNESLFHFVEIFNNTSQYSEIVIINFEFDNMSDDGLIYFSNLNKVLVFDWEKRFKYFKNGMFAFSSLGQFERKFNKNPKIDLTIQCDSSEQNILVAFHEDFDNVPLLVSKKQILFKMK